DDLAEFRVLSLAGLQHPACGERLWIGGDPAALKCGLVARWPRLGPPARVPACYGGGTSRAQAGDGEAAWSGRRARFQGGTLMSTTIGATGVLSPREHARELRRAIVAATVGTTIEWYDFLLYSTMAGLVFGKVFFTNEAPLTATLNSFAIYFVGFVARPIGAFIFGHYGDRVGRKSTLIITLVLMGVSTFL